MDISVELWNVVINEIFSREAACPSCMILDLFFLGWWLKYLEGYFRSARFLGSDVCAIVTICLVIRQSGEGCPCQEGGQGTNSFLFLDTSIYQAWLHASHTLKVEVCVCVHTRACVLACVCMQAGEMVKDQGRGTGLRKSDTFTGLPGGALFWHFSYF